MKSYLFNSVFVNIKYVINNNYYKEILETAFSEGVGGIARGSGGAHDPPPHPL